MRRRPTTPITSGSSAGVGSGIDPYRSAEATLCDELRAETDPPGTEENVSGSSSWVQWPNGQAMTMARPTTELSDTVPLYASVRW